MRTSLGVRSLSRADNQLFRAPTKLPPPQPLPQPDMLVQSVRAGSQGESVRLKTIVGGHSPTLMTMSFKDYGRRQCLQWHQVAYDAGLVADTGYTASAGNDMTVVPSLGTLRVLDVNVMEGWLLRMLRGVLFKGLAAASPQWLPAAAHLATHTEVQRWCGGDALAVADRVRHRCCVESSKSITDCWAMLSCLTATASSDGSKAAHPAST